MDNRQELLNRLWDLSVNGLINKLESGDYTSQDINVARQLLRDHNINVDKPEASPLAGLSKVLPFKTGTDD
tara:strand:- start:300 stop:512 length:213 start_codon:yes stop_codon:yes gene_type:complete